MVEQIKQDAVRLTNYDDLDYLINEIGDAKYVLLGEASHGTSEFYKTRAELTKRLVKDKGFNFVGVEGDWPSCYELNRYIKSYEGASTSVDDAMKDFRRWPTWMWANVEIEELVEWLKDFNSNSKQDKKIGFYGIDIYSLYESMEEIINYLEKIGSEDVKIAKRAFSCFQPYERTEQDYGVSASFLSEDCVDEVIALLMEIQNHKSQYKHDEESSLNLEINALVAKNGEEYYRSMVQGGPDSWNIRDMHMVEALNRLMDFHGKDAKAIVWEHNTHIGDARATDMKEEGMVNVGQLIRENEGQENVFAIGFGTHRGTVIAGSEWGAPMEKMMVPPAMSGSWEDLMHLAGEEDKMLLLGQNSTSYKETVGHRAIGVVYNPDYERYGNYVPSVMASRYDAFIYHDQTNALNPLKQI
ncbi:erythromycin esterase family protein [Pseudalkalibacillus caeni]|uniref:Erythromycin esterase family protein n=1 Tax=Exobacillus caeni TaxID=2574798 RepID=A0A5R9FAS2_9BACL|nr:erythromycin esterase family protein [Pseudalkalibacillus caeni]TLS36725.1 erythromycin esterase family protein [Pseudalkalibacillus caeni]